MGNTGYKSFANLELYYEDNGSSTGQPTKPNVVTDPDYIAPVLDTVTCAPSTRYYSVEKKLSTTKNNCSNGYSGSNVTLTANANQFVSTVSLADANAQADAWLAENVQINANNAGTCELTVLPSYRAWKFSNPGRNSSGLACGNSTFTNTWYTTYQTGYTPAMGSTVYTNSTLNSPVSGDNLWYNLQDAFIEGDARSYQINKSGVLSASASCA
jgi:hypothetical protein